LVGPIEADAAAAAAIAAALALLAAAESYALVVFLLDSAGFIFLLVAL
jgi:hypothetical protein